MKPHQSDRCDLIATLTPGKVDLIEAGYLYFSIIYRYTILARQSSDTLNITRRDPSIGRAGERGEFTKKAFLERITH